LLALTLRLRRYTFCMTTRFEWDAGKSRINQTRHNGLDFETAARVFDDPNVILKEDRIVEGKQRWHAIGAVSGYRCQLALKALRIAVIPAQAGIHFAWRPCFQTLAQRIPACAGMTRSARRNDTSARLCGSPVGRARLPLVIRQSRSRRRKERVGSRYPTNPSRAGWRRVKLCDLVSKG